ncbi:translocation/assembly module TamB domain-containing protein [Erythrobacter sp. HKB08]|uniref:translocation/assembly module TamB domain-containing protein n=1 Tax=Erythrobacter sp. HKB08 TaxID=2502843 RepID=UPI0010089CCB|nr:translocation/assembly module TamB domain-containing protein [Erythrobacter sp. HKB08]
MSEETEDLPEETPTKRTSWPRRLIKWSGRILLALLLVVTAGLLVLNSPIGKRFITDQIAKMAPASGLRIEIGRIEGDLYDDAILHDVVLSDPKGRFLTIPRVELDWRPLNWFTSGLDVRKLVAERGTLLRMPELEPGDPDAPILPDFDIRVDRFEINEFTIAEGVIDEKSHPLDLSGKADIRSGRALLETEGQFGKTDSFAFLLDAEPDGDKFDLDARYDADEGGVLATMLGADAPYTGRLVGDGTWTKWDGALVVRRRDARFAALTIENRAGEYTIAGQIRPAGALEGLLANASGPVLSVGAIGTLEDSVLDGEIALRSRALRLFADGALDLADNAAERVVFRANLLDPELFGESLRLEDARLAGTIDGAFRDLSITHRLEASRLVSGDVTVADIAQAGTARYDGNRWLLPLDASVASVETGNEFFDSRLRGGTLGGTLVYTGRELRSDDLRVAFPDLTAQLALFGDLPAGNYGIAGPVNARGIALENIGTASGTANIRLGIPANGAWSLQAALDASVGQISNDTIANLAGDPIRLAGNLSLSSGAPIAFNDFTLRAERLTMTLDGRIEEGTPSLVGSGTQAQYGDFTVTATLADDGPRAELVFASPLPAAGLENVRVALAPSENGFDIETEGGSLLGPFSGELEFISPEGGPSSIAIERLDVWKSRVTGNLELTDGGANGRLAVSGGGLDGRIGLATRDGGQGFAIDLEANQAEFAGPTTIRLGRADIEARGFIPGSASLTRETLLEGSLYAEGLDFGGVFLGRAAANANLKGGRGEVTASLSGRRGSRFGLQVNADIMPERIAVAGRGTYAGEQIRFPRRAVFTALGDGGWELQPTQLSYGDGATIVSGSFGGGDTKLRLQMDEMPLSLVDLAVTDIGLGGTISGVVDYNDSTGAPPTGEARVKVDDLTRSGLVLTSRPVDLALVADLTPSAFAARAVIDDSGKRLGRVQARVSNMAASGSLFDRVLEGDLLAQLRYDGPADALWRLAAIEGFDLTGPLSAAANATGTLADPRVRGSISSDNLRVRSLISGTDVKNVSARGTFAGSRLRLTRFSGSTDNGGTVSGSGTVDLVDLGERGPAMDIKIAAKNAQLLNANGLSATLTGPLRIVSNGIGGTIAGRVRVDRANWRLGVAADDLSLPQIRTREINIPADIRPPRAASQPWRYLVDATATSRIDVDGMGLDSEWGADIILRGTTDDPRIGGEARVVRGSYSFAGTRFELTRGQIDFDENVPIDPRLDIRAETQKDGLDVTVFVTGNALQPEIRFESSPPLPEEEILARLLFGGSIANLSATDALQLGAAVASLRGGGGMDPINKLRSAIGLDRLRIVSADPALNRGTGVALGKNIGRRFYIEIITDGRGYSATEVEFRVTNWLSLLATVSTIGRESVVAEISRDY